jgi:D-beta-D-heptose 7-phosphate kinase/D-beta-D-heptose 1-phosphate adenosyltransferase
MPLSVARARSLLKAFAGRRVLVVGDLMLDHYIWGDTHRISPEAPVPVVTVECETYTPGGAANVALNCAALGAETSVLGIWGDDEAGQRLQTSLREAGIKLLGRPAAAVPTIVKTRVFLRSQQLCRLDQEAPPAAYQPEVPALDRLLKKALVDCEVVLLSDYAKGFLTTALVNTLGQRAHAAGQLMGLDPKPRNRLDLAHVDVLTPNRSEAAALADVSWDPTTTFPGEEVCQHLHEQHDLRHLVVTMSEEGMLISTRGQPMQRIPTTAREVFDVSGAGDTSFATLMLGLATGTDLETSAQLANAAAGVVVGKLGTATATPAEILAHLSRPPAA